MLRVLFVDDQDDWHEIIARNLEPLGSAVTLLHAKSYSTAERVLIEQTPIDVVVSDLQYSGRKDTAKYNPLGSGGLDLLEDFRTDNPATQFVFFTARPAGSVLSEVTARGIKPPSAVLGRTGQNALSNLITYLKDISSPERPLEVATASCDKTHEFH